MGNKKWQLFEVGMRRDDWRGMPDGLIMEWSDESGLTLFVFYNSPDKEERASMASGQRFEIAFKDVEGIGFFCLKFGKLPWSDCCFSPNLYSERPNFDAPVPGETYALHMMLIDSSVGELVALRSIALGREFTESFRNWANASLERDIDRSYYNRVISDVFVLYPSSDRLAAAADFRWVRPEGKDEHRREVTREERE